MSEQKSPQKRVIGSLEVFLLVIIILNILDFFQIIGSELDYVKKLLSWTLLGIVLYRVSPSKVLFGRRHQDVDVLVLLAYFVLSLKNLLLYAEVAVQTAGAYMIPVLNSSFTLLPFYDTLLRSSGEFTLWTFITGSTLLIALSVFVAFKVTILKRSVLGVIHEEGEPTRKFFAWRVIVSFVSFLAFYLFVFSFMMEWLAIAVDYLIVVGALFLYSFLLVRHKVFAKDIIVKVGNVGSDFYYSFIDHFRTRKGLLIGISGLLVLHVVTDIGVYLIPYMSGLPHALYMKFTEYEYYSVWESLSQSLQGGLFDQITMVVVFLANVIGVLLLFLSPVLLWYAVYRDRRISLPSSYLVLFFTCLPALLVWPLFRMSRLNTEDVVGVNIAVLPLTSNYYSVLIIALFCVFALLCIRLRMKQWLTNSWAGVSIVFFFTYTWLFFSDIFLGLQSLVFTFANIGGVFLALMFFLLTGLTVAFYAGGFIVFLILVLKHTVISHRK